MRVSLFSIVVLIVVCLQVVTLAVRSHHPHHAEDREKTRDDRSSFFPIGAWYSGGKYRAPTISRDPLSERSQWQADLQAIKNLGFNMVKTWVDWASVESTRGTYDLTGLEQLLALANSTGLRVLIQIYADSAPDWVDSAFPDTEFETETGVHIHSQAAPGPCQDNSDPRAAVGAFYQAVARVAVQYPSTFGYDVWSEPTVVNWVWFNDLPSAQFCYCNASMSRFRQWLQNKYGDLDTLNAAWYRTFSDWSQVEAPRFGTILTYTDYVDFMSFTTDKLAEDLEFYASNIRAIDSVHVIASHSAAPSVDESPQGTYGTPDDWKMNSIASSLDYYGSSIYPKHASAVIGGRTPVDIAFMFDGAFSASRGRGWYVGELQAGQGVTGMRFNVPVTPIDVESWIWSAIAHGAKSISFFSYYSMNQGYEAGGYGLVGLDGVSTARAQAAGAQAAVVSQNSGLILRSFPSPAVVAILYNPLVFVAGGNTVTVGINPILSMEGIYESLWQLNIPVDFLHVDDAVNGRLARYKLLYVPFALALNSSVSQAITDWVATGGKVVAEARTAWTNENGFTAPEIPPAPLSKVFGVQEISVMPLTALSSAPILSFGSNSPIAAFDGISFPAQVFQESLAATSNATQILATFPDGSTAATLSNFGNGSAMFVGSYFGIAAQNAVASPGAIRFIQQIATSWADIAAPLTILNCQKPIEARLMYSQTDAAYLVILVNSQAFSFENCVVQVAGQFAGYKCSDLKTGNSVACTVQSSSLLSIDLSQFQNAISAAIQLN